MDRLKKTWQHVPRHIRRPIVLVVGVLLILLAGSIGWLPGPGGIPLMLAGIAVLATEFAWAERLRDGMLNLIHRIGIWIRKYPVTSGIIITISVLCSATFFYQSFLHK